MSDREAAQMLYVGWFVFVFETVNKMAHFLFNRRDESSKFLIIAFSEQLDAAIAKVAHPAGDGEAASQGLARVAKSYPLNPARKEKSTTTLGHLRLPVCISVAFGQPQAVGVEQGCSGISNRAPIGSRRDARNVEQRAKEIHILSGEACTKQVVMPRNKLARKGKGQW
jgi:hypothetical protein